MYEQYGYLVHRRCARLLPTKADADDALQEVFLRAQRYGRKEATGSDLGWLYGIADNCCFDALAKRKREPLAPTTASEPTYGSSSDGDTRAVLGALLAKFDEVTRTIGVLYFLSGFTQDEVAQHTGYSRKTIGKKLEHFETEAKRLWRSAQ